jgi:hypothetical protein
MCCTERLYFRKKKKCPAMKIIPYIVKDAWGMQKSHGQKTSILQSQRIL